jgi:hypothetical protein
VERGNDFLANWVTPIIIIKKKPIEIVFLIGDGRDKDASRAF